MPFTMGLDIGTSAIKAVLFDTESGRITSSAKQATPLLHPRSEWSEHDPQALWLAAASAIREAASGRKVEAIAISGFAEAGLPLDRSMQPIYPIIAWFDERSKPQIEYVLERKTEAELFAATGQIIGFSFGLLKTLWLRESMPDVFKRMAMWLSVPDFMHYKLCGQIATDHTLASRTLMFDQSTKQWSPPMLEIAGISVAMLPKIQPSGTAIGHLSRASAELTGLQEETLCVLGGHDHLCGAFACGGASSGALVDSMGSSQAVIAITGQFDPVAELLENGYVHYAHIVPGTYLIKGGLKAAGKALGWFGDVFNITAESADLSLLAAYDRKLPYWLPYFQGSGTPNRQPDAHAMLHGLHTGHSSGQILLALLEGFAFWLQKNIDSISRITNDDPHQIIAIGGANQNKVLQQLKAAISGKVLTVPSTPEASAVGAALLAALGCGIANSYTEAANLNQYPSDQVHPDPGLKDIITDRYNNGYLPLSRAFPFFENK